MYIRSMLTFRWITIPFLALSLHLTSTLSAKVVYTAIEPDTTLKATVENPFHQYQIDLNDDGQTEFYFKHFKPTENLADAEFYTMIGREGEVLADADDSPFGFEVHTAINENSSGWINRASSSTSWALSLGRYFAGKGSRYLGLRFKLNNNWHYAWLRVEVPADTSYIKLMDFAYETEPDSSIKAGQGNTSRSKPLPNAAFSIYPNPVDLVVNIYIEGTENALLKILNATGQQIHEARLEPNTTKLIDVSNWPSGIYTCCIHSDSGRLTKQMVIR